MFKTILEYIYIYIKCYSLNIRWRCSEPRIYISLNACTTIARKHLLNKFKGALWWVGVLMLEVSWASIFGTKHDPMEHYEHQAFNNLDRNTYNRSIIKILKTPGRLKSGKTDLLTLDNKVLKKNNFQECRVVAT